MAHLARPEMTRGGMWLGCRLRYLARGLGAPVRSEPLHPDIRRMPRFRPAISGLSWSNFRPFLT